MRLTIAFQRLEAVAIVLASVYFYHRLHRSFLLFALLLFSIDLFMLGYLTSNRVGAYIYNIGHSLALPLVMLVLGTALGNEISMTLSLIWFAHIGLDRALGYGLKFTSGFNDTHLGSIGKSPHSANNLRRHTP